MSAVHWKCNNHKSPRASFSVLFFTFIDIDNISAIGQFRPNCISIGLELKRYMHWRMSAYVGIDLQMWQNTKILISSYSNLPSRRCASNFVSDSPFLLPRQRMVLSRICVWHHYAACRTWICRSREGAWHTNRDWRNECVGLGWRRQRFPVRRWCCWRNISWWCHSSGKTTSPLPNSRTSCWAPTTWTTPSTRFYMYVLYCIYMWYVWKQEVWIVAMYVHRNVTETSPYLSFRL